MTAEERIASLHKKMKTFRRAKERRHLMTCGAGCGMLALSLFMMCSDYNAQCGKKTGLHSAAVMLFEDAGGYVLTAVIAFVVGVAITVICKWQQKKKEQSEMNSCKEKEPEAIGFLTDDTIMMAAGGKNSDQESETQEKKE